VRTHTPDTSTQYQTTEERDVVERLAWWSYEELVTTQETVYPPSLPELLTINIEQQRLPINIRM